MKDDGQRRRGDLLPEHASAHPVSKRWPADVAGPARRIDELAMWAGAEWRSPRRAVTGGSPASFIGPPAIAGRMRKM